MGLSLITEKYGRELTQVFLTVNAKMCLLLTQHVHLTSLKLYETNGNIKNPPFFQQRVTKIPGADITFFWTIPLNQRALVTPHTWSYHPIEVGFVQENNCFGEKSKSNNRLCASNRLPTTPPYHINNVIVDLDV